MNIFDETKLWMLGNRRYFYKADHKPIEISNGVISDLDKNQYYSVGSGIFIPFIPLKDSFENKGTKYQNDLILLLEKYFPMYIKEKRTSDLHLAPDLVGYIH